MKEAEKKKHLKHCPFVISEEYSTYCYKGCNWFDETIGDCVVWTLRVLLKLLLEEKGYVLEREKEK